MRRPLLLLAAGTMLVVAAACSKKNSSTGGGGGDVLTTGSYAASSASVSPDGCKVTPIEVATGDTVTVLAGTTSNGVPANYTIDDLPFIASNTTLITPVISQVYDWTSTTAQIASGLSPLSQGYDCVETQSFANSATITGHNAFHYQQLVNFVVTSGQTPACIAAEDSEFNAGLTTYPCNSTAVYDASR